MRVDEKIKKIVESIDGLNYEYNDWTRANVTLDNLPLPVCLYILPVYGSLLNKNGNFRDHPNAMIAFLDKAEFDFDGKDNEPTVEKMKYLAKKFVIAVNDSRMFRPLPENIPYSVVYDQLDVNLTGVVLNITLEEEVGMCINK